MAKTQEGLEMAKKIQVGQLDEDKADLDKDKQ